MAYLEPDIDKPVVVLGTSGFAVELAGLLLGAGIRLHGFVGPEPQQSLPEEWLGDDQVLGTLPSDTTALVAIGDPAVRRKVSQKLEYYAVEQATFIHPDAHVSPGATLERGCMIYPNATIHAGVALGQGVLVNSNTTIGHETRLGAFSNVGPGAAIGGRCTFGPAVYIGIGASVIENLHIAGGVVLGAGATVISDAQEPGTYVGVPARRLEP